MKFNMHALKSLLRSLLGVAVGVGAYLAGDPKYAALGAIVPFVLRYLDPTETQMGIGKKIGNMVDPKAGNAVSPQTGGAPVA